MLKLSNKWGKFTGGMWFHKTVIVHSLRNTYIRIVKIKLLALNRLNYKEISLRIDTTFPGAAGYEVFIVL